MALIFSISYRSHLVFRLLHVIRRKFLKYLPHTKMCVSAASLSEMNEMFCDFKRVVVVERNGVLHSRGFW